MKDENSKNNNSDGFYTLNDVRRFDSERIKKVIKKKDIKNKGFKPLSRDYIFKSVFKQNTKSLKELITILLDGYISKEIDINKLNISIIDSELPKNKTDEYQKKTDIITEFKDTDNINKIIVNIEENNTPFKYVKNRNLTYLIACYILLLNEGESYSVLKYRYLYQININLSEKNSMYGEDYTIMVWSNSKQEIDYNIKSIVYNIDYYKNSDYNGDKSDIKYLWLKLITASSYEEIYKLLGKLVSKKERQRILEVLIKMEKDYYNIINDEVLNQLVINEYRKESYNSGKAYGMRQGISQGISQTALNMLTDNVDLSLISKYTGLDKNKILLLRDDYS